MSKAFIFALINFLLLAALLYFVGWKIVVKMFRGRRERISRDLDEAAAGLEAEKQIETTIREAELKSETELAEIKAGAEEHIGAVVKTTAQVAESEKAVREKRFASEIDNFNVGMRRKVEADFIRSVGEALNAASLKLPPDYDKLCVKRIIDKIKPGTGDAGYLVHNKKLPVTITSAKPLDNAIIRQMVSAIYEKYRPIVKPENIDIAIKLNPAFMGGVRVRICDTVYNTSIKNFIETLPERVNIPAPKKNANCDSMRLALEKGFKYVSNDVDIYQYGTVVSVSDGICHISGLSDAMYGELLEFKNGSRGMVLDLETNYVGCVIFGDFQKVEEGTLVRRSGHIIEVPVGDAMLGRVVNALGTPIDGFGDIVESGHRPIEFTAPGITDRKSVSVPLHTGIKAIDALVPIGRGQRELIIGDRQTGKTAIAVDTIINQKGKNVVCIYVAIGQKETSIATLCDNLKKHGAMDYTIIVCADANDSAPMQYIVPYSGTAMGEYFMYSGRDVLIIYDDLSKHAVAYRELSLLLHRPSGREAYPGDVFYLHSRLLERSARLSSEAGGGSMTALPIIETQAGDISAYIPTNAISITDGQIFLESDLFHEGQRPAVNVGLSVSRVGGSAQTGAMRQISGRLRMDLAQYRELVSFSQFGSDLDQSTKETLARGERMTAVLKQAQYTPMPVEQQVVVIYAVAEGFASDIEPEKLHAFENGLITYVKNSHAELLPEIAGLEKTRMSEELIERMRKVIAEYKETLV